MPKSPYLASIEACASHYGDEADAVKAYIFEDVINDSEMADIREDITDLGIDSQFQRVQKSMHWAG